MEVRSQYANKKMDALDFAGSLYEMIGSEMSAFVGKHGGNTGGWR